MTLETERGTNTELRHGQDLSMKERNNGEKNIGCLTIGFANLLYTFCVRYVRTLRAVRGSASSLVQYVLTYTVHGPYTD